MTELQKNTYLLLLKGGSISAGSNGYRVRNEKHMVEWKISSPSFYVLKNVLRKTKNGLFVIDKNAIRTLHGNNWVKKQYRKLLSVKS